MSLTDLKKNQHARSKKKKMTVDQFIAEAENYAKGRAETSNSTEYNHLNLALDMDQALLLTKQHLEQKQQAQHTPFRRATFTLSEQAIAQLTELSQGSDLAKSHIIRILINELCNEQQRDRLQKLFRSPIS